MSKPDDKILDLSMFRKKPEEEPAAFEKNLEFSEKSGKPGVGEEELNSESEETTEEFYGSEEETGQISGEFEEFAEESGEAESDEFDEETEEVESEDFGKEFEEAEFEEFDGEFEETEFDEETEEAGYEELDEEFDEEFEVTDSEEGKEAEILDFELGKAKKAAEQTDDYENEDEDSEVYESDEDEPYGESEETKSEFKEKLKAVLGGIGLAVLVAAIFAVALIARDKLAEKDKKSEGTPVATENEADENANSPYAWWFNRDVTEGVSVATDADAQGSADKLEKGERVLFGTYNQGPEGEVDKISWIVLDVQEDYALLTTEYVVDMMPYSKSGVVQWADSDIRSWLNDGFFNQAFSSKEKESILSFTVENNDNPLYNTEGGDNTEDRVVLLSLDEVNKYFGNIEKEGVATPFALEKSGATGGRRSVTYWLRSPGSTDIIGIEPGNGAVVDSDGNVSHEGNAVTYTMIGIRPVIRIKL